MKIFYRFPSIYFYESNAATVQIPIETEILYFLLQNSYKSKEYFDREVIGPEYFAT
jgi:hypothetical protein